MVHPSRRWNRFPCPRSHSAKRADRMERLGLFLDGNSGAAAFSLPQTKDGLEEQGGRQPLLLMFEKTAARTDARTNRQGKQKGLLRAALRITCRSAA